MSAKGRAPNNRTEVLRHYSANRKEKGEFVAIVSYSGAGKTTLISMIAGLIKPDSGTITLNDLEITGRVRSGDIVFQIIPCSWMGRLRKHLSGRGSGFPNWAPAKKQQHTEKYIAMVHLTPARDKKPSELSGGMRQRVSVARWRWSRRFCCWTSRSARWTLSLAPRCRTRSIASGIRTENRRAHHERCGRRHSARGSNHP
jgi:ABC-type nitrate/sulfonate/bicarbonate transport system ATPase subunit